MWPPGQKFEAPDLICLKKMWVLAGCIEGVCVHEVVCDCERKFLSKD